MAKEVTAQIKLQVPAGQATPAPPVGPALGQHGVNIGQFVSQFNEATRDQMGMIIPVIISVYADRTFSFIMKSPPAAVLLKQAAEAGDVFGVEIAEEAVAKAKEKGVKATQLDIDASPLPFDDNYFDIVYCGELIEHLFNPDHLLEEIHRVLKSGGKCIISTPNLAGWPSRFALLLGYQPYPTAVSPNNESVGKLLIKKSEGQWGHIRVFTARALRELLVLHHFKIKKLLKIWVLIFQFFIKTT